MNLNKYHKVYFIGIGGIGMSALARYFKAFGKMVAGYDKTETELTSAISSIGIEIHYKDDLEAVPEEFKNPLDTLVVYTPAIPSSHSELQFFKSNNFDLKKRAEVLGEITKDSYCFAVAGTHGKTTTTSILAHLLYECQVSFSAFLGGISENFNSNLVLNGMDVTVVEADEFDRSFLTLSPNLACITSMDADHLDVYGDDNSIKASFKEFIKCIKPNGKLFFRNGLDLTGITYGIQDDSDYTAQNIRIVQGSYVFDFKTPYEVIQDFKFNLPGRHNLSNAIIALAMTAEYGLPQPQLVKALSSYKGVKRRFTTHINNDDIVYIDDYAHHPTEIQAVYEAVKEMHPNKTILAVFQPHLYSRTRDFGKDFAEQLSKFDSVILLDIYPARELPIEGISSGWLLNQLMNPNKEIVSKSNLTAKIIEKNAEVVVTMGAGDISNEVSRIKRVLSYES